MAVYKQGILGSFSGKVGTVVGSSWRGVPYLRSLATKVANPRTAAQVEVRGRLATTVKQLRLFTETVRRGFVDGGGVAAGWSAAVRRNIALLEADGAGGYKLSPDKMELSDGTAAFDVSVTNAAGRLSLTWGAPAKGDDFYGGKVYMAAFNAKNGKAANFSAAISAGSASFSLTSLLDGADDDVSIYTFAANATMSSATKRQKME